ncbi:MAG: hypothetical protein NTW19_11680, partial [Planctomycetota bacterium]|nr:hypothetical protein [Planctomycetota bacterium]
FMVFLDYADRARVRLIFRTRGGTVTKLRPREGPIWARILNSIAVTHWDVDYIDRQGRPYKARVTASRRRCVVESDEPADAVPPEKAEARPKDGTGFGDRSA